MPQRTITRTAVQTQHLRYALVLNKYMLSLFGAKDFDSLCESLKDPHLEAYDSGEGKIAQTKRLRQVLLDEVEKGNYVIAGGDFNQVFSNTDLSAYPLHEKTWQAGLIDINEFDDRFSFMTDASIPTCRSLDAPLVSVKNKDPENFQYYVIDGFIISDNIEVHDINTISTDFVYSDHNPLCVEITLK